MALGWLLALGILLLGLTMTGLRVGLAQLDDYSDQLEDYLGRQLGLDVELEGLQGRVQGWLPRVSITRASLAAPGAEPAIVLRNLELELDPLRSLLAGAPVAANLSLGESDLNLTLTSDGTLGVLGGDVPADVQLSTLADLFFMAGYVRLHESRIRLYAMEDDGGRFDALWLQGELNHGRRVGQGLLDVRYRAASQNVGEPRQTLAGTLQYALRGRPWDDPGWRGTLALRGQDGYLGDVLGRLLPVDLRLQGPVERFNLLLTRDPERGRELRGEIAMPELAFAGRAPLHGVDLAFEATGVDQPDGAARLTRFRAETVGRALHLDGMTAAWHQSHPGVWFVDLPAVDLAAAAGVIAQIPAFPGGVHSWLAGLAPTGQLQEARLALFADGQRAWFHGHVDQLSLQAFRGVPGVEGVSGHLTAHEGGGWLDIDSGPFSLHFADIFPSAWNYRGGRGRLMLQLLDGRPQLVARDLRVSADHVAGQAAFLLDLAAPPEARQLALLVGIERGEATAARDYLPQNMPAGLRVWMAEALQGGAVTEGAIVLHAGLAPEAAASRLPQLHFGMAAGDLLFAPDWPLARDLQGTIGLHHGDFSADVAAGRLQASALQDVRVRVPAGSGQVLLQGLLRGTGDAMLTTLTELPLEDRYQLASGFMLSGGMVEVDLDMALELQGQDPLQQLQVATRLDDVAVRVPELELDAASLSGWVHYDHPGALRGEDLRVHALGGEADVRVRQDAPGEIRIGIDGQAQAEAVASWLAIDWLDAAAGQFPYSSEIRIRTPGEIDVMIEADTAALRLGLPAPLTLPGSLLELDLHVPVTGDWELGLQWGDLSGQFGLTGRAVRNGTVGYGVPAAERPERGWQVVADVAAIDLEAWWIWAAGRQTAGEGDAATTDEALGIEVTSEQLLWGDWHLGPGVLQLQQAAGVNRLELNSSQLQGVLVQEADTALKLDLDVLRWPIPRNALQVEAADAVPTSRPLDLGWLGAAEVSIAELWLQDRLLGSVDFLLQMAGEELVLDELNANLRGLAFGAAGDESARLIWQGGGRPASRLRGRVSGDDAAAILQAWGLAPTLEAETFQVDLDLSWPGSPMEFDAADLRGQVLLDVENGRFVQFETGAAPLRVVGLFNFAAIARRMRLDFTDVFRRGIAFEQIDGALALDNGVIRSQEAVRISGPGSSFRLTGSLDLVAQTLDGDIIVTLPVSENLPWFAAYAILLANPLAGAGVFVAERVFRDQIDRFSSARYRLLGTFEQPEVSFVSIFPADPEVPITLPPPDEGLLAPELDLDWLIELDAPLDWLRPVPLLPPQEDDS